MFNVLSMPRASWKARLFFIALTIMTISVVVQQWPYLHDNLAIARWVAWVSMVSCILCLPQMLVIVILGRLPKAFRAAPGRLNKTLPQIHAEIAREQKELRDNSREL